MFDRLRGLLNRKREPRPDLACPHCGADNVDYASFCKACGKSLDNYWHRETNAFTRDYDDGFNNGVFIMRKADSCPACQQLQGIVYKPWDLPRLPVDACTHKEGCRCMYMAVTRMQFGWPGLGLVERHRDRERRRAEGRLRRESEALAHEQEERWQQPRPKDGDDGEE